VVGAVGLSAVLSKAAALAAPALLYPIWGPWLRAGARNLELYARQFRHAGLWRAVVLSVALSPWGPPPAYGRGRGGGAAAREAVSVVVGDPWEGGARAELLFPHTPGAERLAPGEPAELLVLSGDRSFASFRVVREVYCPASGLWLSEYPFLDRGRFLDVSLDIERGRARAAAGGGDAYGGGGDAYGGGYGDAPLEAQVLRSEPGDDGYYGGGPPQPPQQPQRPPTPPPGAGGW